MPMFRFENNREQMARLKKKRLCVFLFPREVAFADGNCGLVWLGPYLSWFTLDIDDEVRIVETNVEWSWRDVPRAIWCGSSAEIGTTVLCALAVMVINWFG